MRTPILAAIVALTALGCAPAIAQSTTTTPAPSTTVAPAPHATPISLTGTAACAGKAWTITWVASGPQGAYITTALGDAAIGSTPWQNNTMTATYTLRAVTYAVGMSWDVGGPYMASAMSNQVTVARPRCAG
jgi:hypothetical protein